MVEQTQDTTDFEIKGDNDINPLDKSYESLKSDEKEDLHYNIDSDAEPPTDQVGDNLTIIQKRQVTKTILSTGEGLGKPGRPYIVKVEIEGYFAAT